MERRPLATDEIYHIYNRGVDKRVVFPDDSYYSRFFSVVKHYLRYDYPYSVFLHRRRNNEDLKSLTLKLDPYRWKKPPVEILSLCLMPNHFHFQMKQLVDGGISKFMHRLGTGYTNYFNTRNERTGSLFQGSFKSVWVESDGQFSCLSRYIHVNPIAAGLVDLKTLYSWKWSSLLEYSGKRKDGICNTADVLSYFKDSKGYLDFVSADFKESEREGLVDLAIDDDFGWFEEEQDRKRYLKKRLMASYARG